MRGGEEEARGGEQSTHLPGIPEVPSRYVPCLGRGQGSQKEKERTKKRAGKRAPAASWQGKCPGPSRCSKCVYSLLQEKTESRKGEEAKRGKEANGGHRYGETVLVWHTAGAQSMPTSLPGGTRQTRREGRVKDGRRRDGRRGRVWALPVNTRHLINAHFLPGWSQKHRRNKQRVHRKGQGQGGTGRRVKRGEEAFPCLQ